MSDSFSVVSVQSFVKENKLQKKEEKILPKHSFWLLAVACIFSAGIVSMGDKLNEGFNFAPIVFFSIAGVVWILLGFFNVYKYDFKNLINYIIWIFSAVVVGGVLCLSLINENPGVAVILTGLPIVIVAAAVLLYLKKLNTQNAVMLLFALGFILRLAYILYTDVGVAGVSGQMRQHDVFYFNTPNDQYYRHSDYIEWFYNNFSLPKVKPQGLRQFYHPPLHHFTSAIWMRINTFLGCSYSTAVENIQVLTLFYSSACMIISAKILQFLKLKGMAVILPLSVICLHPTLIIMSGSVNNDMLSTVLAFGAVYATMVWYKKPSLKNIIVIALCIGGSMTAKLSGGLVAPAVALVFLVVLINKTKSKGFQKGFVGMIPQFCIFALICVPLGLWWQIRNAMLFDVPLTYVPSLSYEDPNYLGNIKGLDRLFNLSSDTLKNIFVAIKSENGYSEYNVFLGIIKTAVFGEYTLFKAGREMSQALVSFAVIICKILFWSCVALVGFSIWGIVHSLAKKRFVYDWVITAMFLLVAGVIIGNYVNFCFQYPFTCTQNFRYCVPVLLSGMVFTAMLCRDMFKSKSLVMKISRYAIITTTVVFCLSAVTVYTLLGMA